MLLTSFNTSSITCWAKSGAHLNPWRDVCICIYQMAWQWHKTFGLVCQAQMCIIAWRCHVWWKKLYPEIWPNISVMIGKVCYFSIIAFLMECKLVIWWTCTSCLGVIKASDSHSEAQNGSSIPSSTVWSSSFLKVCWCT